jgi:hypothetical protein
MPSPNFTKAYPPSKATVCCRAYCPFHGPGWVPFNDTRIQDFIMKTIAVAGLVNVIVALGFILLCLPAHAAGSGVTSKTPHQLRSL